MFDLYTHDSLTKITNFKIKSLIFNVFVLFFITFYAAFSVSRQNRILQNTKQMMKLTKLTKLIIMTKNGSKTLFLGLKKGFWGHKEGNTFYFVFTEYTEYIASKSNLYFGEKTHSNSYINLKFDYKFGSQGFTPYPSPSVIW